LDDNCTIYSPTKPSKKNACVKTGERRLNEWVVIVVIDPLENVSLLKTSMKENDEENECFSKFNKYSTYKSGEKEVDKIQFFN
jgi:hypothetical protein